MKHLLFLIVLAKRVDYETSQVGIRGYEDTELDYVQEYDEEYEEYEEYEEEEPGYDEQDSSDYDQEYSSDSIDQEYSSDTPTFETTAKDVKPKKLQQPASHLKPFHYVFAMVMTLLGLYTNLFGSDQTKVVLFLYGSTIFLLIAYAIVQSIQHASWIAYVLSLGLGWILGGFLFMWLEMIVGYIASIFTGYVLASVILVFMVLPTWIKIVVGSVFVIVAIVLNYFIQLFPISTSILGAFCFCSGIDLVFQWGFVEMLGVYWNEKSHVSIALAVVFVVMAIVGSVVQMLVRRNRRKAEELYQEIGVNKSTKDLGKYTRLP